MINLEKLINVTDDTEINNSIIELDNFIAELCSYGENLEKLTEPQKNFYFNQCLEREINNGGFNQYFLNSSGSYASETVNSLKLIGADSTSEILKKAINQFPNKDIPFDQDDREKIIDQIENDVNDKWEKFEQEFFEYNDDLNLLNLEYVRNNKDSFL